MLLCEACGQNPATVKIEKNVNGQPVSKCVCQACAKRIGAFFGETQQKRCRVCGKSFGEITADFSVGCEYCYTEFKNELTPVIERVQKL